MRNFRRSLKPYKKKKYNKIILISNVGTDYDGKEFVSEARKIIGNDVVVLFMTYSISHLYWIKDYKNAIFSNDPKFYEDYLKCFEANNIYFVKKNIDALIESKEKHYKVKFDFNNEYLNFPYYKESGKYSDLTF